MSSLIDFSMGGPAMSVVFLTVAATLFLLAILISIPKGYGLIYFWKKMYHSGACFWGKALPITAIMLVIFIIVVSLSPEAQESLGVLSLRPYFKKQELLLFLIATPFFLTIFGNFLALIMAVFLMLRLMVTDANTSQFMGYSLLLASIWFITLLGDNLHSSKVMGTASLVGDKIRYISKIILSFCSLILITLSLSDLSAIINWLRDGFAFPLVFPSTMITFLLVVLAVGWISVFFGLTAHLIYPILSIPTAILATFYVTPATYPFIVVPTSIALALMLSSERNPETPVMLRNF
jgi:hypothetical protein